MKANSALTAMLLLLTLLAAVPALWALEFPPPITGHLSGCHDSIPENPPSAPRSHQCCAGGHNWAVTVSPVIPRPATELARIRTQTEDLETVLFSDRPLPLFSYGSPPTTSSLRI